MSKEHDRCHYCNREFTPTSDIDSYVCRECGYGGASTETDHDCKCQDSVEKSGENGE